MVGPLSWYKRAHRRDYVVILRDAESMTQFAALCLFRFGRHRVETLQIDPIGYVLDASAYANAAQEIANRLTVGYHRIELVEPRESFVGHRVQVKKVFDVHGLMVGFWASCGHTRGAVTQGH